MDHNNSTFMFYPGLYSVANGMPSRDPQNMLLNLPIIFLAILFSVTYYSLNITEIIPKYIVFLLQLERLLLASINFG